MDLTGYKEDIYRDIGKEYTAFMQEIGLNPSFFIPVSGREGDNIAYPSQHMSWYKGPTVLEALDEFPAAGLPVDLPLRMPVQGVYKFTKDGDTRRIVAGTIETGQLKVGDEVIFYPSGKRSRVKTIEAFSSDPSANRTNVTAGWATGFTLTEEIYDHKSVVIFITGPKGEKRKSVAKALERRLFYEGKTVYYLGMGNVLYGLDADIRGTTENNLELMRRLAEVTNIMLEAGLILIVTAVGLSRTDLEWIKTAVDPNKVQSVWVGESVPEDPCYDLYIPLGEADEKAVSKIKSLLQERGIIFKP